MPASLTLRRPTLLTLWLCLCQWLFTLAGLAQNAPKAMIDYRIDWHNADSLMARGLPKSALAIADRVYAEAKQTNNQPQLLKAALRRVVFRTQAASDDETYLTLIRELTADIADARGATRAVLQSVLAEVYGQYYQNNRYRFLNRTATAADADVTGPDATTEAGAVATDPRAWDARRLMQTITALYAASVREAHSLQQTPLTAYDAVLTLGTDEGRSLRPTLYDVLAQRAIQFFSNTENDLPRPIRAFEINDPAYVSDAETFARNALPRTDTLSGPYQALALYQALTRFHLTDKDPMTLAVVDVERLQFVQRAGSVPAERDRLEKTLRQAIARHKGQPSEAEYALALVQLLAQAEPGVPPRYGRGGTPAPADSARRWDRKTAASLARDLIARFPGTYPARQAEPLLHNLLKAALAVQTEEVVEPDKPFRARVDFQNTKTLFYKLLRLTPDELLTFDAADYQRDPYRDNWFAALQNHTVAAQGQLALPDDGDLHSHSVEIPLEALPVGHYALLVSNEGRFAKPSEERAEIVGIGKVVVSGLAYLQPGGNRGNGPTRSLVVVNRQTGAPLTGVSVTVLTAKDQARGEQNAFTPGVTVQTDKQGNVMLGSGQLPLQRAYVVRLTNGTDILDAGPFYQYGAGAFPAEPEPAETRSAAIFTDRAIYRPGQTIYVKVLLYQGKDNAYAVVPNQPLAIRLNDANGEEVAKLSVTTNEFGTATGTFTAPVGRLTGRMTLVANTGKVGYETAIQVEEYKRPTFAVVAEPLKQAPTLGQTVTVRATAKTLAGAVVDGAAVSYRVTRMYIQPYWHGWRSFRPGMGSVQEITNGTTTTQADGTVSLTFVAQPDASIDPNDKPRFTYTVSIDVTDRSGETRNTTQTLEIGYTALSARLDVPDPVLTTDKATYAVKLTNASNVPVALKSGTVAIVRLQPPRNGAPLRRRLWDRPDRTLLTRAEFEHRFPLDLYADEDNPATWNKTPVRTEPATAVSLAGLPPGLYEAQLQATDSTGQTAAETVFFTVIDPQRLSAPPRLGEFVQVIQKTAQPGGEAVFWVGTAQPGYVLMAVEEQGKIVRQEWLTITNGPVRVALPVQEKHRGGFGVHVAMVQNGRVLTQSETVAVPFTDKQLTIETETFRTKLQPGQAEQWTLRVSGPNRDKVLAELTATLYDASLDQFVGHDWKQRFYHTYIASTYWESGRFGVQVTRQYWLMPEPTYPQASRLFPDLSWGPYVYEGYNGRFRFNRVIPRTANIWVQRDEDRLTGRVLLGQDEGLSGVRVRLKNTKRVVTTSIDGSFRLELPRNHKKPTLTFSLIGFLTTEVTLGDKRLVSATMEEDQTALNEVVAVGYGGGRPGRQVQANYKRGRGDYAGTDAAFGSAAMAAAPQAANLHEFVVAEPLPSNAQSVRPATASVAPPVIRKNFNETAFFFPQVQTDAQGRVVFKFTMPEALTSWRLLTFAHTKTMQTGRFEATVQTQKELMVTTNVPRFLRENDTLRLTARLDNLSQRLLDGTARLDVTNALTGEPLSHQVGVNVPDVAFTAQAGQSAVVGWRLVVPPGLEAQGLPPVAFRVTARAGTFTDGEERVVPVLPNRMLVTDVQPFWISGGDKTKTVRLTELTDRNPEVPTQTERLTVEVTSNPAWYALQSLPYLMGYPYDCAEQLFSKLYANALGAHILNSRPAFRQVVDAWKQTPPKSPLATNEALRAVVLENTPWLADAKSETERTAKLGQFFDQNSLAAEQRRAIEKLMQLQDGSGGLMWFSGMQPNLQISLHVLAGLGHLQKLGVRFESDVNNKLRRLQSGLIRYADAEAQRLMVQAKRATKAKSSSDGYWAAMYLYARSFYLSSTPVGNDLQTYLLPAVQKGWQQSNLQGQALAALTLHRYGLKPDALTVLQSLTERSKLSDELGLYWPDNVSGTFWYQAPIETQAYLIEAYGEAGDRADSDAFAWYRKQAAFAKTTGNQVFIDKMQQWLVQQKRTQSWPSTKATTEAIYALLLTGSDWLDTKATTTVRVGGQNIASLPNRRASQADALTGYQNVTFGPAEVTPAMGVIEVSKSAKTGISWGAVYWQHFEPLDAVAKSGLSNLNVKKTLFRRRSTDAGPVLEPITPQTPLQPGDLLSVRVVLTTDRAMEYVHLKDGRASGFEPVATLSGTKYQNGVLYYEAPRDASTDVFIEYLPTGTHVFEYGLRVVHAGEFGIGVATVQCFYAPEFAAHSNGGRITVRSER